MRVYVRHEGALRAESGEDLKVFPAGEGTTILVGDWSAVQRELEEDRERIRYHHLENDRRQLGRAPAGPQAHRGPHRARGHDPGRGQIGEHVIVMMERSSTLAPWSGPGPWWT